MFKILRHCIPNCLLYAIREHHRSEDTFSIYFYYYYLLLLFYFYFFSFYNTTCTSIYSIDRFGESGRFLLRSLLVRCFFFLAIGNYIIRLGGIWYNCCNGTSFPELLFCLYIIIWPGKDYWKEKKGGFVLDSPQSIQVDDGGDNNARLRRASCFCWLGREFMDCIDYWTGI